MGRALLAVGGALVLCFAVLGIAVFATRERDSLAVDNLLAERVTRAVALAEARDEDVDLARLTDFEWDRVLLVERRTPAERISRELGFEFTGELNYDAESPVLLVFADGGRLARFADYRGPAQFVDVERPIDAFARREAVFVVQGLLVRPK